MAKANKENKIRFGLRAIHTDEFATIDIPDLDDKNVKTAYSFVLSLHEFDLTSISFKLTFTHRDRPFIISQVTCVFEVKLESLDVDSSGKLILPKDFVTHLAFLTTGTMRGVLHAKLEQSQYSKFMLPILDVSSTFTEDVFLDSPKQASKKAS
jgi:hypothetical protein